MDETTRAIDKEKARRILALLLIGLIVLLAVFFYGKQKAEKEAQEPLQTQPEAGSKEEILKGLSAPSGNPPPTEEEKREILEGLSAPASPGTPPPTEEEKRAILEGLSKPSP